ncbi:hypothetical protein RLIN73S_02055 [Rhodanobacter lindaniclasticus]
MVSNGNMRVRSKPSCSSVLTRDCWISRVSAWRVSSSSMLWIDTRSDTDSASAREYCCSCE